MKLTARRSLLCALVLWLCAVGQAQAFERSMTCGSGNGAFECEPDEEPIAIAWPTMCLQMHVNETGSAQVNAEEARAVLERSLAAWNEVDCSHLSMSYGGLTDEDRVGYSTGAEGNANVLVFRDTGWPHARGILALTSVTYSPRTGEIVDADIEFNTESYTLTTTDPPLPVRIDFENTLTHELGHFFGLDHTDEPAATMFSTAPEGEVSKRTLEPDDIAGVCAIYPAEGEAPTCDTTETYFDRASADTQEDVNGGCCNASMARGPGPGGLWALLCFGGLLMWRRRERAGRG